MLLWIAAALAHGPAPAILDVLAWDPGDGAADVCEAVPVGAAPLVLRTNVGVHRRGEDGGYVFGCPARWGDAETPLATSSPEGDRWALASGTAVYWTADGGCSAADLGLPTTDTPVALRWWGDAAWLVTRRFADGSSGLWRVDGALTEAHRWADHAADAVLPDGDLLWVAGAQPAPWLETFDGAELAARTPTWPALPESERLDRLAPRLADRGGVWLLAGSGATRRLWWTDGVAVEEGPGPAGSILGPARVGDALVAVVDEALWVRPLDGDAASWRDTGSAVPWTCLQPVGDAALACVQGEARWVSALDGDAPVEVTVASLDQLGPPDAACPDPGDACALDWLHFGGESGWTTSTPAACPGEARTPIPEPPPDEAGCGCASGAPPLGVLGALGALAGLARRRRAVGPRAVGRSGCGDSSAR